MQCLILAGGLGTRMRPATEEIPKAMIEVGGRPFVDHQLEWLAEGGVESVVFSIGHKGSAIRDHVVDGGTWGLSVHYVDEGTQLMGTGGAVRLAVDAGVLNDAFLLLYGDSYLQVDIGAVWAASGQGAEPLMTVFRNDGAWDKSNVIFDGERVELYEKGREDAQDIGMRHIDYGLSVLRRDIVSDYIRRATVHDLADLFHGLSVNGRLRGFEVSERFYEIGSPGGLADFAKHFKDKRS